MKKRLEVYENTTALFVVGGLLSVISIISLFSGIGFISILFGFFGGLICFLAWNPEDYINLPLIGAVLGAIGFLGGLIKFFSTYD